MRRQPLTNPEGRSLMARATFRSRRDASRCWLQNPASRHLPIYGISRDGDHPKNGVVGQCQEEGPTGNGSRNERPRSGLKQHFGKLGGLGLSRRDSCCVLLRPAIGMPSLRGSCCASLPEFEACCRNHRLTNELYAMPRKHHAEARTLLCAVSYAETHSACEALRTEFTNGYWKLAPKAVERLAYD